MVINKSLGDLFKNDRKEVLQLRKVEVLIYHKIDRIPFIYVCVCVHVYVRVSVVSLYICVCGCYVCLYVCAILKIVEDID